VISTNLANLQNNTDILGYISAIVDKKNAVTIFVNNSAAKMITMLPKLIHF